MWLSYELSCPASAPDLLAHKFPVQPGRTGAYSCRRVLRYPTDSEDAVVGACPLHGVGKLALTAVGRYTINLANQQLSQEGNVLLLRGTHFLLQVD